MIYVPEFKCEINDRMNRLEVTGYCGAGPSSCDFTWDTQNVHDAMNQCKLVDACNFVQESGGSGEGTFYLCKGSLPIMEGIVTLIYKTQYHCNNKSR